MLSRGLSLSACSRLKPSCAATAIIARSLSSFSLPPSSSSSSSTSPSPSTPSSFNPSSLPVPPFAPSRYLIRPHAPTRFRLPTASFCSQPFPRPSSPSSPPANSSSSSSSSSSPSTSSSSSSSSSTPSKKITSLNDTCYSEPKQTGLLGANTKAWVSVLLAMGVLGLLSVTVDYFTDEAAAEEENGSEGAGNSSPFKIPAREDLPTFDIEDVRSHCSPGDVYVTYQHGVYDVSEWADIHPGGKARLMLAAGKSIDPFWALYAQHMTPEVHEILERYRVGNVELDEEALELLDASDPFSSDPTRHPALLVRSPKPFNAETPPALLSDYLTESEVFYVRNHLPVPLVDPEEYILTVQGDGLPDIIFTLNDLKSLFDKHTVTATVQCAGNRRNDITAVKPVRGGEWDIGAISNATWSGARLKDVIEFLDAGISFPEYQHVSFEGLDTDGTRSYGASIPLHKALDEYGDVLLAYEMNGNTLPRDHGYPIRALVPGTIGARSVKWLGRIYLGKEESESHWQRNDYRSFSPNIDWDNVDFKSAPSMQDFPVQSAITFPCNNDVVHLSDEYVTVKGYAWAGGGREIIRVDVTPDNGKSWLTAELLERDDEESEKRFEENPSRRDWAWKLWEVTVPLEGSTTPSPSTTATTTAADSIANTTTATTPSTQKAVDTLSIRVRAWDSAYNTQPERPETIWNLRGIISNAWHCVNVRVVEE